MSLFFISYVSKEELNILGDMLCLLCCRELDENIGTTLISVRKIGTAANNQLA